MVFVTGGTGLLGTHILLELIARGEKVRALKRPDSDLSQVESVFNFYLGSKGPELFQKIEWVEGDLLDIQSLDSAIQGCAKVYHAAAMVSFLRRDFRSMWRINKVGTENIVNVCLSQSVEELIYISSTATIGKKNNMEFQTEENKLQMDKNNSGYSVTKNSAEMEVWRGIEEGLNTIILNPSIIFGPGNWNQSSISIFKVVKKGLRFFTPGSNAFVDVRDIATIAAELSERKIYNDRFLVISENLPFKVVFEKIAAAFGVKAPSTAVKPWMAQLAWRIEGLLRVLFGRKQNITRETARSAMNSTKFSNDKIKKELNFQFIPVDDSIENAVKYFKSKEL